MCQCVCVNSTSVLHCVFLKVLSGKRAVPLLLTTLLPYDHTVIFHHDQEQAKLQKKAKKTTEKKGWCTLTLQRCCMSTSRLSDVFTWPFIECCLELKLLLLLMTCTDDLFFKPYLAPTRFRRQSCEALAQQETDLKNLGVRLHHIFCGHLLVSHYIHSVLNFLQTHVFLYDATSFDEVSQPAWCHSQFFVQNLEPRILVSVGHYCRNEGCVQEVYDLAAQNWIDYDRLLKLLQLCITGLASHGASLFPFVPSPALDGPCMSTHVQDQHIATDINTIFTLTDLSQLLGLFVFSRKLVENFPPAVSHTCQKQICTGHFYTWI